MELLYFNYFIFFFKIFLQNIINSLNIIVIIIILFHNNFHFSHHSFLCHFIRFLNAYNQILIFIMDNSILLFIANLIHINVRIMLLY